MKKLINLIALLFVVVSCSSDDSGDNEENTPLTITVSVSNVTDHEATLSWSVTGNSNTVTYRVVLDNQTIVDGYNQTNYTLTDLAETTAFTGSVFAFEQGAEQAFTEFNFTTLLDTTFEGDFYINSPNDLDNFYYTSVSGEFEIAGNNLTNLNGLESLKEVGNLTIRSILLTNLNGLENLDRFTNGTGRILLEKNNNLTDVSALQSLSANAGTVFIDNAPNLTDLTGLNVRNNGSIFIRNCPTSSLAVFQDVTSLQILEIKNTPNINSFSDLSNLTELKKLNIKEQSQDISLQALENVSITEIIELEYLDQLSSLEGLQGTSALTKELSLLDLPQISNLNGLNNIQSIGTNLQGGTFGLTIRNLGISDLSGLSSLELCSQIKIFDLPNLTNLGGTSLNASIPDGLRLRINRNKNLTDFCGFTNLANNVDFIIYDVGGNGYNPTQVQMRSNDNCSL